ncbi:MAG: alpha/beta hydrolase [Gammaproteobacteria bacterium]|nr:alpha/beta hydrolase [Gammaproteobacteria bacterium]
MKFDINGNLTHVATGGKPFDAGLPSVLFLHGSGMDHRAWALQTRWFAYNGYSVLAPDFPGHSLSHGEPLINIEMSADWLVDLLTASGVKSVHVVAHSQGFLSALELASRHPELVRSLTGIGTANAIPVNPALIETAKKSSAAAADMMLQWGFGPQMHLGISPTPGMQPIAVGRKIMSDNPLAVDLQCCADYKAGDAAAAKITAPTLMILAGQDKMTPMKAGKAAAQALNAKIIVFPEYGHMLPIEAPKKVLHAIRDFIVANSD